MFTTLPVFAAAITGRSVGRETQNLQDVDHLPGLGRLILCVHVGKNRDTDLLLDLGRDGKSLL